MASRGQSNKLHPTWGRGRIIRHGHLATQSECRCHQPITPMQPTPPPVQPTPPSPVQPTLSPSVQPTPPPVVQPTLPPLVQPPPPQSDLLQANTSRANDPAIEDDEVEVEDIQLDHDEYKRDADGKVIIRPFGKGLTPALVATDALGTTIKQHFQGP
ncbi:hypothetical protein SESBI_24953 [Sesbania bispinosa]|nr:hypothetical protein SESBI_24953 [Sesbania bispinosa]